jgi:transcription elongation factor Elf1
MTAKEEDMLTSRTLLRKGIALERVMQSLIVDKRISPNTLLVGDRNAILIAARISGYGADYETNITCPQCGTTQGHTFDLIDATQVRHSEIDTNQITANEDGTFTATLPATKVEVSFRLLTGNDEKNLLNQIENARKSKKEENTITRQLKQFIVSVNGDATQETINYLVNNVPSSDSRYLRNLFARVTPDVNLTQNFECSECNYDSVMEVPLTADFFWPDR